MLNIVKKHWLFANVTHTRDKKFLKQFGYHLRELRQNKGLTQEQLANDADIPINQIGRIERGEINPTLSTLKAIAIALSISLKDMFDEDSMS